jgi:hypothetical protein
VLDDHLEVALIGVVLNRVVKERDGFWLTAGASLVVRLLKYWVRASDFEVLVNIVDGTDDLIQAGGVES